MARKLLAIKHPLRQATHQLTLNRLYRLGFLAVAVLMASFLGWACSSGSSGSSDESGNPASYTVTPLAGDNGSIVPDTEQTVKEGETVSFDIIPDEYYIIDEVTGNCGGSLNNNTYTTGIINGDCTVSVSFSSGDSDTSDDSDTSNNVSFVLALNDTGFTTCGNYAWPNTDESYHSNWLDCEETGATADTAGEDEYGYPVPAGQDANFGRDATAMASGGLSKLGGGAAGFDFTKLGGDGEPLEIQHAAWDSDGDEANGTRWSCVRDNHTGLIWEVKVDDEKNKHHRDNIYTWEEAGGTFVDLVNDSRLCGEDDWRLPTVQELLNIVHNGRSGLQINMDLEYFPNPSEAALWNAPGEGFWSSTLQASNAKNAWRVMTVNGAASASDVTIRRSVRLVRDGQ